MVRRVRRLTLATGKAEKPAAGYKWYLYKGHIGHVTGTLSALALRTKEVENQGLALIAAAVPTDNYPTCFLKEITIGATTYIQQMVTDVYGLMVTPEEDLLLTADAGAYASILLLEVSDDDKTANVTPAPLLSTPKQPQRVDWWQ